MAKLMDEILQALKNLGGQAKTQEIANEIERMRSVKFSEKERGHIKTYLHLYATKYKSPDGKPYFNRVNTATWAINDEMHMKSSVTASSQTKNKIYSPETVPFEVIANSLKTIKEYRDYYDPQRVDWIDYIYEIFHVLGFSTERIDTRLFFVKDMVGVANRLIALCSYPGEDETFITPGISWDSYLMFAASHYQVNRGILTDGLKLQIINYENHSSEPLMCWSDLDEIVKGQKLENFFSIYKMFSSFRYETNINRRSDIFRTDKTRRELIIEFWQSLLEQVGALLPNFSNINPSRNHWISGRAGKSGLTFAFVVRTNDAQIELYIDQEDQEKNKHYFDALHSHKEGIEQSFGDALDWQRLVDKRACRIRYVINTSGLSDQENWPELQKQMIEAMVRFQNAFSLEISRLR
jgi:hypothetical protein